MGFTDHLCILAIILPLSTAAKNIYFNDSKITEFEKIDTKNSSIAYVVMYKLITYWLSDYNRRMGVLNTPMALAHPLHPIKRRSRNKRRKTCGLDDVFLPDDLGSGPCTPFIIYIPHIIAAFLVIKISSFWDTCIPKVGVAMLVYWMVWYCYCFLSSVHFSCIVQYSQYHNMGVGTMWHWILVSSTPSQSIGLFFWVCVVLVLSITMCSCYYFLDRILLHHDFHHYSCDYHCDFYGH